MNSQSTNVVCGLTGSRIESVSRELSLTIIHLHLAFVVCNVVDRREKIFNNFYSLEY